MEKSKITLEALAPLAEAEREHWEKFESFRAARDALRAVVNGIEKRQQREAEKIVGMLEELEAEEQKLKKAAREQAEARALCLLTGQQPPEKDLGTGARLAAIPEEKEALEALRGRRAITAQEREKYEAALEVARDAADEGEKAAKRRRDEIESVFSLVSAARGRFEGIPHPFELSDITDHVYRLSTSPEDEAERIEYETPYGILRGGRKA